MILRSQPQSLSIRDIMRQHDLSTNAANNNILAELNEPMSGLRMESRVPPQHIES